MKNIKTILLMMVMAAALAVPAFSQEEPAPLTKNMIGGYFVYTRSDSQRPENAVGAGILATRNFRVGNQTVNAMADFYSFSDQAFAGSGQVFRGEVKARAPIGLKYNFVGMDSEVYAVAAAGVETQRGGNTFFNPEIGAGFKTGDNVLTEYRYVISPNLSNSVRGHKISVEVYRPLESNSKWLVVTKFYGMAGRFQAGPVDPQALSKVVFGIGLAKLN